MKKSCKKNNRGSRSLKFEQLETRELLAGDVSNSFNVLSDAHSNVVEVSNASLEQNNAIQTSGEYADGWYILSSSIDPSADEQELLEQFNRFRSDPEGELDRIFSVASDDALIARNSYVNDSILLNSYPKNDKSQFLKEWDSIELVAPLAFNSALESSAYAHSSYMKSRNDLSHQCVKEDPLLQRVAKAGFRSGSNSDGSSIGVGENIGGGFTSNGEWSVASYISAAFSVDWGVSTHGHRDAMANAAYTEVGISILQTNKSIGPSLVTCDFGSSVQGASDEGAYLLGVIYDDLDNDFFYDVGEGLGDVSILVERLDDPADVQSVTFSSWTAGGYQIFLANGSYRITVSGEGLAVPMTATTSIVNGINVKLDFRANDAGSVPPVVDLNGDDEGINWNITYVEGSEDPLEVFSASRFAIIDEDSAYLYGAKVYFGSRPDGAAETLDLSVVGTDLRASFDDQSGYITIDGAGSLAEYEDVIASLTYYNDSELCDLSDRDVLISVFDGASWSEEAKLTISIEATNLPILTVHELSVYEGDEGSQATNFVVELDSPARMDVSFNFNVVPTGTALEGESFVVAKGDPITIKSGETTALIPCYITGNYDALKPEGLDATEDGFENPFTYFVLELVDVVNATVGNEDSLVKGIIYDDDSPVVLGKTDEYRYLNPLSVDNGARRYHFTLAPENSGVFTWNVQSLGLPEGTHVTVRENSFESTPIASSTISAQTSKVQWFADPDIEYWVTIESQEDFCSLAAQLLELTDEKVVLVDPVLADADEELVALMWEDEGMALNIGDFDWEFDNEFWNGLTFKTTLPDVAFSTALLPRSTGTVVSDSDETSMLFDDAGTIKTVGFGKFIYYGNDENESLTFTGTSGDDYLYYSNGSGYLLTSSGTTTSFEGVNKVFVNGGGGEDYAYIEDTTFNDRLETQNGSLGMYGGGFSLVAANFPKSRVIFCQGGEDVYYVEDSGDDVTAIVSQTSSVITGTYSTNVNASDEISSASLEVENEIPQDDGTRRSYTRTVTGAEHMIVAPVESIGALSLFGDNSANSYFSAEIGGVSAYNNRTQATTDIKRVKSLTVSDVNPASDERFDLEYPSDCQMYLDGNYVVVIDPRSNWSIRVPSWKFNGLQSELGEKDPEILSTSSTITTDSNNLSNALASKAYDENEFNHLDEVFATWEDDGYLDTLQLNLGEGLLDETQSLLDFVAWFNENNRKNRKRLV